MMKVPVLVHPQAEDISRIGGAVADVNQLQSFFRLELENATWLPNGDDEIDTDQIERRIKARASGTTPIAVVNNPFDDDYFSHGDRDWNAVTVWDWEALYAPPSLRIFLVYQFAGALLDFAADLGSEVSENMEHKPSIGCFFDFCEKKSDILLGMVAANLCGECEAALCALGLPEQGLRAVEKLLAHVRAQTIRRPKSIPNRIFIGHGHSPAWRELERLLTQELKLSVVEFNVDPTAGLTTVERLKDMLAQATFAFIVMTAEDMRGDGKAHARENVIHEVGLFQAGLGFGRAIILKECGCEDFSNIHGLTYVEFPAGKLLRAKGEIVRTLEREGIL